MQAYVEYFQTHGQEYVYMIWQHLYLSLLAVGIAAAVGIPCGILSLRAPRIKKILTTGFSALRIIPSLAVLVILIPIMGVGVKPALTALVILAIPPILIQTTLAFSQVPDFLLEVADAMGMDKKRKFRQVEVPLAMPGIISGIRMAMSEVIASATLAAYIGAGGLGILIFNGINLLKTEYLVIGGGTVAVITMLCSMALGAVEKKISRAR